MPNEKPILFNTEMVIAILEGRKTQTRRVIKPQPLPDASIEMYSFLDVLHIRDANFFLGEDLGGIDCFYANYVPTPYQKGDVLYVRETWRDRWGMAYANYGCGEAYPIDDVREIQYKAGGNGYFLRGVNLCPGEATIKWDDWEDKWKPSIHMPRKAARLFLKVTNVRVERLGDITEEDVRAEGFSDEYIRDAKLYGIEKKYGHVVGWFARLWDSLNYKRGYMDGKLTLGYG